MAKRTAKNKNPAKLTGQSKDIRGELLATLKKTAPGVFTEGKVDFDRLRAVLAERVTKKFMDKVLAEKPEKFTCLDAAFKNNDPLKTNTALQMEAAKIEFKVI